MHQAHKYHIYPIGRVHQEDDACWIDVFEPYRAGLHGIEQFSHVTVLFWCHEKSTPQDRSTLRVHPCGDEANPQTGVFATRSPARPNPIAVSVCRLLHVRPSRIDLASIDALDQSPVVDIKGYFPDSTRGENIVIPQWRYPRPDGP